MPCHPLGEALGRFFSGDLAYSEGMIANNDISHQTDVALGSSRLLVCPGIPQQVTVELFPTAVETFNRVIGTQLFNSSASTH